MKFQLAASYTYNVNFPDYIHLRITPSQIFSIKRKNRAMTSLNSQWTLICLLSFLTVVASFTDVRDMNIDEYIDYINPPAVHKFVNEHGHTILCVLYEDQISFRGFEQRSAQTRDDQKLKSGLNFSSHGVERTCPEGTVAIMETKRELVERAGSVARFISKKGSVGSPKNNKGLIDNHGYGHEYGIAQFVPSGQEIHGAIGGLNVWQPYVDTSDDGIFSLCQIWIVYQGDQQETMEVGWIVNPSTYGDSNTHFFIYWTNDGYGKTGCWNLNCPGFVLAPGAPAYPGSALSSVSTYEGEQVVLTINVIKESDRWNLYVNNQILGWWPASLFTNLRSGSNRVDFGGEVAFSPGSQGSALTTTDMGSGHFPSEGYGRSAHIRDIQITDNNGQLIDIPGTATAGRPECYNVKIEEANQNRKIVYFGGPGGDNSGCVV